MAKTNNLEKKYVSAIYDFLDDGGAQAAITPATTSVVPTGSLINSVCVETIVLNAGSGNTMTVNIGGVDVTKAMTIGERAVATPFVTLLAQDITSTTAPMICTLATANLTAGKCRIIVGYFEPVAV